MKSSSIQTVPVKLPEPIRLANVPTRIVRYPALEDVFSGREVWIKRDDETGCLLSGNKVRKLGYLAADALAQGCDTLVTTGAIQSNHARATAIVARELGLDAVLVLTGARPDTTEGNLFLDALVGADIRTVEARTDDEVEAAMQDVADELLAQGKRPYVIPAGGSNELGAMGCAEASAEIARQARERGLTIDCIVSAVGSCGTYAGLLLGAKLQGLTAHVVGFNISRTAERARGRSLDLCRCTIDRYGLDVGIGEEDIRIIDGYVGAGYGKTWPEELDLIRLIAKRAGVILDPVYTGKAFFGLVDQLKRGHLAEYKTLLFVHTGGIFGALARRQELLTGTPQP